MTCKLSAPEQKHRSTLHWRDTRSEDKLNDQRLSDMRQTCVVSEVCPLSVTCQQWLQRDPCHEVLLLALSALLTRV